MLGGGRGSRLDPLTRLRSKPAVPLAGNYRLIDVAISNALNSDMLRVFVLTQFNSVSLHEHIQRTYLFSPFSRGFVNVLAAQQTPGAESWFQGTADAVRQNLLFLDEQPGEWVLVLSGDHLYRLDFRNMLRDHVANDADVTLAVLPCSEREIAGYGAVRVDDSARVVEFREKPATPDTLAGMEIPGALRARTGGSEGRPYLASMGIYLYSKRALRESLAQSGNDFGRHLLPRAVEAGRVQAHLFDGYWRDIGTIGAFYDAHMDLVEAKPAFDFHDDAWRIFTRPRYLPGARVQGSDIDRCIIASGALISNGRLQETIVGLRSIVNGATLRRTLVMGVDDHFPDAGPDAPPVGIGAGTVIEKAIVDKNARIGRNVRLVNEQGVETAEGDGWVIRDGVIVVPKNAVVRDGTVV
ncbi:MAG: sugar phosphate nucleotidyltransferase [Planctomycetota bacterium]|nr:sugar phosphate nucleotidyltransferase [Planctomycetota bacterium]